MIDPRDIPGHRPDNDREQVAALGEATPATIQDSLMVRPGAGWRGHLPLCRGPGGTMARRMAALVRGRR
jgi:hypothetical protein